MTPDRPRWPAAKISSPEVPSLRQLTSLITAVVVIGGLSLGREVLIPITLAVMLSFLVAPLVDLLRRTKLGQLPSVIVAVVLALTVIGGVGTLIGEQVAQLATQVPKYQSAIEKKIARLQGMTLGRANAFLGSASKDLQKSPKSTDAAPDQNLDTSKGSEKAPMLVAVQDPPPSPIALAQRFLSPVISPLETTGIVLVVAIFILLQREDLRDRLIRLFGSRDLHRTTTAMDEAAYRLSRYFLAQFAVNFGVGVVISSGLAIIGVPGAILFGVLTALLRFVPYIGTWIAAVLALVLAAAGPDWSSLLWTVALFAATDLITGQVIEPLLYGHSTGLSPVAVIVAAIFWSWLWGPVGLVLSTPLTLCLVILGRHVEKLEFLEVLFGDQPPLTPPANFYQRILADDPDEALEQAESLLKDMPLVDFYDSVVLDGLRLAHNDLMRGVIKPEQLTRIKEALVDILDGLEDLADQVGQGASVASGGAESEPSPQDLRLAFDTDNRILCVAGRGMLDGLLATALVQLIRKTGVIADMANHDQFSRTRLNEVNLSGTTTICIVSLDAEQSAAYTRILLRRLRQRAPDASLVYGFVTENMIAERRDESGTSA